MHLVARWENILGLLAQITLCLMLKSSHSGVLGRLCSFIDSISLGLFETPHYRHVKLIWNKRWLGGSFDSVEFDTTIVCRLKRALVIQSVINLKIPMNKNNEKY